MSECLCIDVVVLKSLCLKMAEQSEYHILLLKVYGETLFEGSRCSLFRNLSFIVSDELRKLSLINILNEYSLKRPSKQYMVLLKKIRL